MEALKYQLLVTCIGSYITCIRFYVHRTRDTTLSMDVVTDVADDLSKGRTVEGVSNAWHYECHVIS
jgi:hypothetical protein